MSTAPNLTEIKDRLLKHFSPTESFVFIFGSRADDSARINSDWDIGIVAQKTIRGATMEKAREELEEIRTLHSFDLVNFANVSDQFKKIALSHIKPLFGNNDLLHSNLGK